jgi:glycerol kinase
LSENPNVVFGTIDTYLIAKLTNLERIVTDSTNASRTMLMDLKTL